MQRLRGQDAAFWYGETPAWHMHMGTLMVLDPTDAPDFGFTQFRDLLLSRLHLVPLFKLRVVEVPFGVDRPVFIEQEPDPEYHIRRTAVPAPGGRAEVEELISRLMSLKIDRTRPLWEMWFIEGLEGGRVGLFGKCHHSVVDGASGAGMIEAYLDVEPVPRHVEPPPPSDPEPIPAPVELFVKGLANTAVLTPRRAAKMTRQLVRQAATFAGWMRSDQRPPLYFESPRTRLNGDFTAHRTISGTSVELDRVKAVKRALDVKVNDVVLGLSAGAIRQYLLATDELPDEPLTAQVPVSLRTEGDQEVGNKIGTMSVSLATDVEDPVERVRAIYASSSSAKEMRQALSAHQLIGISEAAPPLLVGLAAQAYTASGLTARTSPTNCVISNVPGPNFPFYVAGAVVESFLPIGPPVYGIALNITAFSYRNRLEMGFTTVPELLPDVRSMADNVEGVLAELERAVAKPKARKKAPRKSRAG